MQSLVAPEEPFNPALLYVGVATLTGSVLGRNRILFTRLLLPPALFVLSFNHFLPKTAHNVSEYLGSLEERYLPTVAEKHAIANAHSAMTWERAKEATASGRESVTRNVGDVLARLQAVTGLKLQEALGVSQPFKQATKSQVQEIVHVVQQKTEEARENVEAKVEETTEIVEKKVNEIKRLV